MNELRKAFLDFFKKNQHAIYDSAPLIPYQDNSLLFVNAGMVPFKDFFLKKIKPSHINIATAQKCIRAGGKHNDLENVGFTKRHHTFFEMLGNFSFGDYFKERAINLAWEFLTKELGLKKEKLYITVYHNDDEAFLIWQKVSGFNKDKIIKISTNDNFWQMGDNGPCGPCSEIFYDHGEHLPGLLPDKGDTGERFVEIWNLVFMQFSKNQAGEFEPLPEKCIDTGMGLERISAVIEGTDDNYATEIFRCIIAHAKTLINNANNNHGYKIIADHLRSSAFLIAEGIMPSNHGRGYVLRKIIRRAVRHTYMLGYHKSLMKALFPVLKDYMGEQYPELIRAEDSIVEILDFEEFCFRNMLKKGVEILNDFTQVMENNMLSGHKAFILYDTYGFPLEITKEILAEKNISIDEQGFENCMNEQRERARKSWIGSGEKEIDEQLFSIYENYGNTEFVGYKTHSIECKIVGIIAPTKQDHNILIILNQTPFYAESGGQEGDKGIIEGIGFSIDVLYTRKALNNLYLHECLIKNGTPKVGDSVTATINSERRTKIKAAHSATHILHYALRTMFGKQVAQKGSLVSENRLRFDFNHNRGLTDDEIINIERFVNELLWQNFPVSTQVKNIDQAFKEGAIGLFGEKYDNDVRVVTIGSSVELCGGTHVDSSADIGLFKISSESSIGAGIRRIEAFTGSKALDFVNDTNLKLKESLIQLNNKIIEEQRKHDNAIFSLNKKIAHLAPKSKEHLPNMEYITQVLEEIPLEHAKRIIIEYKDAIDSGIIVLINIHQGKSTLIIAVTRNIANKISAANLIHQISSQLNLGTGGGKAEIAQCSCMADNPSKIFIAIKEAILNNQ